MTKLKKLLVSNNCLEQFLKNCNETLDFPVESDQEFITQSFIWEDTKKGKEYWRGIALKASSYRYKRRKMFSEILKELSNVS